MSQAALDAALRALPPLTACTLNDFKLALLDLLTARKEAALLTRAGQLYVPISEPLLAELSALPPHILQGVPLADALSDADTHHDACGAALWHFAESAARLPRLDPATRAVILRAQQTFVPKRAELRGSFADEAARAVERRPLLKAQSKALAAIPTPDQHTLLDLVDDFISAGEQLDTLLRARAQEREGTSRALAPALRSRTLDTLQSFRDALIHEIRAQLAPLSALDSTFSYLHLLASQRAQSTPSDPT